LPEIERAAATYTEYTVPAAIPAALIIQAMTAGPDGNVWFTFGSLGNYGVGNGDLGAIGSITAAGVIREYFDPAFKLPGGIVAGPDGAMWFTDDTEIGRITVDGRVSKFALPGTHALRITAGLDRKLWFTETGAGKIGRITPTGEISERTIKDYDIPARLAFGARGDLWFTQVGAIGRLTP
jgi:virginiamycin B lyase